MEPFQKVLLSFALVFFVASCAPVMQPPLQALDPSTSRTVGEKFVPRFANFQVILDTSLSMDEESSSERNNFLLARNILRRLNQGIPTDLRYTSGLRSVGHNLHQSKAPTVLLYGMTHYSQTGFHEALGKIRYTGGLTPMATALEAAGSDLKTTTGKSALILISDGLNIDDAPTAAKKIKTELGKNLCIYSISVGKKDNGAGQDMMKTLADIGQCGFATSAEALNDDAKLATFIDNVFIAKKPTVVTQSVVLRDGDSDGDGITDSKDKCPNTTRGELVDEQGCTLKLTLNINFDNDKYAIKPEFKSLLDKAAAYIKRYSDVPYILIAGHTDRVGTAEYNQILSVNRATSVRDYLVENYGINTKRLLVKGYGKLQPATDNGTKEGRYENRRVEIICCAINPETLQ